MWESLNEVPYSKTTCATVFIGSSQFLVESRTAVMFSSVVEGTNQLGLGRTLDRSGASPMMLSSMKSRYGWDCLMNGIYCEDGWKCVSLQAAPSLRAFALSICSMKDDIDGSCDAPMANQSSSLQGMTLGFRIISVQEVSPASVISCEP